MTTRNLDNELEDDDDVLRDMEGDQRHSLYTIG